MYEIACKSLEEIARNREGEHLAEAAKGSSNIELVLEASILQAARENENMEGLCLNFPIQELMLPHTSLNSNTFTGFRNMGNTCFVNAVLQSFLHVDALRRWIKEPRPYEPDLFRQLDLLKLQRSLQKILTWHSSNKWCVIAPVDLLQSLFNLATESNNMLAGLQHDDALECWKLFHTALGSPGNDDAIFWDEPFPFPIQLPQDVHIGISILLNQIATVNYAAKGSIAVRALKVWC